MTEATPALALSGWTLWFGGLAFFTCYFGQTVLGVMQPTIERDLGLSDSEAQWVVNSFFLTLALFAAPGGRLGDYYGHRRVLLVALSIFAIGSLSAAVSQGFVWLIVSIAVAGMGASTLYPSSAAMIANRVPLESRGDARWARYLGDRCHRLRDRPADGGPADRGNRLAGALWGAPGGDRPRCGGDRVASGRQPAGGGAWRASTRPASSS